MEILEILEKVVSIVCPILSLVISIISLVKSNDAIRQVNKIEIGEINKKQIADNNSDSQVMQNMK